MSNHFQFTIPFKVPHPRAEFARTNGKSGNIARALNVSRKLKK